MYKIMMYKIIRMNRWVYFLVGWGVVLGVGWQVLGQEVKQTAIVFNFDNRSGYGGEELSARVTGLVKFGLIKSGKFYASIVDLKTPSVKLALQENRLSEYDFVPPIDADRAKRIGEVLGADAVVSGAIEGCKFEEGPQSVEMTISFKLQNVKTGEVKDTRVTATAKALDKPKTRNALVDEALDNFNSKMLEELFGIKPVIREKKLEGIRSQLPMLFLFGLFVYLVRQ